MECEPRAVCLLRKHRQLSSIPSLKVNSPPFLLFIMLQNEARASTHTHTHRDTHTHTETHTFTKKDIHRDTHTEKHTLTHTETHTHTHTHRDTHSHRHTHMHTHMHCRTPLPQSCIPRLLFSLSWAVSLTLNFSSLSLPSLLGL